MSIRLKPDGTVEADTPGELREYIESTRGRSTRTPLHPGAPVSVDMKQNGGGFGDQIFEELWFRLGEKPQKVLTHLYNADSAVTDVELRQILGYASNAQLAGTMQAIGKVALAFYLAYENVIAKRTVQDVDGVEGAKYSYQLTEGARAAMKANELGEED